MNKKIHGLFLVLFMVPVLFSSPANKAGSFKNLPTGIITFIKNFFSPERVKAATYTGACTFWRVAKVAAVTTFLGNLLLPTTFRRYLGGQPVIGRFIFAREKQLLSL